jgi:hypothetical protein
VVEVRIFEAHEVDLDDAAEQLLADLRPADRAECDALLGPGREREALADSIRRSVLLWVGTAGGQAGAIFGVCPVSMLGGQGLPWLIGTPLIDRHRGAFMRRSPAYIARMLAVFPQLINVVDTRNTRAIAWLRRMGFTILPAQPTGAAGLPFHPFFLNA